MQKWHMFYGRGDNCGHARLIACDWNQCSLPYAFSITGKKIETPSVTSEPMAKICKVGVIVRVRVRVSRH